MSEERNYPLAVVQEGLERHHRDARAIRAAGWLSEIVDLLKLEAACVPPPVERVDTIPEYIYPH